MKKMIKKTSALAISAFMLAQYIPFTAVAAAYTPGTGNNSIVIHSYTIGSDIYENQKTVGANPTGTTADASKVPGTATANSGVTYEIFSATGTNYETKTSLGELDTDANGELTFSKLADGVYWINPKFADTNSAFDNADAFYVQVPGNTSSTVHVYPKNTDNDFNDPTTDNGKLHSVELTKTESDGTTPIAGATFKVYFKNAQDNWEAATPATVYTTDQYGKIKITGLPIGDYYFVEQSVGAAYLLDQEPKKFTITGVLPSGATEAEPVAVSFINDKKLTVGKVIAADAGGSTYNWTITADLPTNRANLSSYTIVDQFKGITIDTTKVAIAGMTNGTDFNAEIGSGANADKMTITFTDAGLTKIKDSTIITANQLTVTVPSTLNSADLTSATYKTGEGAAYNMAQISYTYGYDDTGKEPVLPDGDDPEDPVIITEPSPLPDPSNPSDPNTPTPNTPSDPDTPIEVIKPCTFTISNHGSPELENAHYKITDAAGNTIDGFEDISDDGTTFIATVSGLAPGAYKVYQTAVDSDHVLNNTPVDIYVSKNGNIYTDSNCNTQIVDDKDTTETTDDVANQVVFINAEKKSDFNLPFTGTTATIIFSITGILLMAGTGFLIFILLKKKDDEEEEQENN